ncbi:hypothetical protein [Xanthomonas arboricola]|uniref:hypothetical protein n=1 Tax=Xanthomonas arboricola TaxID=56448 RepID=UPI000F8D4E87|nr:hypothetical protein [Xanthomonas arboricola]
MSQNLQKEMQTFNKKLPELLGVDEGRFALVVGERLVGTFDAYADAVQAGYKEVGLDGVFLVKKIALVEESAYFSRHLTAPAKQNACQA